MTRSEWLLSVVLRAVGCVTMLAVVAVFMPRSWIVLCHEWLGWGAFPDAPVAEYLARCTSLFYVLLGGVLVWMSTDVRRCGPAIVVVAVGTIVCGVVLLSIDMRCGMPWWWTAGDGPFGVGFGIAVLLLQMRSRVERAQADADEAEPRDAGPEGAPRL